MDHTPAPSLEARAALQSYITTALLLCASTSSYLLKPASSICPSPTSSLHVVVSLKPAVLPTLSVVDRPYTLLLMGKNSKKTNPKAGARAPGPPASGQGRSQDVEVETPATPSNNAPPEPVVQPVESPATPAKGRASADTPNRLFGETTSTLLPHNSFKPKPKPESSFLEIPVAQVATSASPTVYGPNSAVLSSDPSSLEVPTVSIHSIQSLSCQLCLEPSNFLLNRSSLQDHLNGDTTPNQRTVVPNTPVADSIDEHGEGHGGPKAPPEVYAVPNLESPSKEKAVRFLHPGPHSVQEHSEAEDAVVTSQDVEEPTTALTQRAPSPTVRQVSLATLLLCVRRS